MEHSHGDDTERRAEAGPAREARPPQTARLVSWWGPWDEVEDYEYLYVDLGGEG